MTDFDVVIASDLRFSGGTSASIAEEIVALAGAGYHTALAHVPGPVVPERTFNPRIVRCLRHDLAELVTPDRTITARLLVMRHPTVFSDPSAPMPTITSDVRVVVVNQPSADGTTALPFYDPADVRATVAERFGGDETWIPIGPLVRQAMQARHPDLAMAEWDWTNVLDVGEWAVDRPPSEGRRPVIGRHSRPQFRKWPSNPRDLLAAYPDDPHYPVKILGGIDERRVFRGLRDVPGWTIYGFNERSVRDFLAEIDFFVYFHHPGWIEAFGRAPLEAMASGAVCILPGHFEAVFGPAALYGKPTDVKPLVDGCWSDPDRVDDQARVARNFVEDRFSHRTHVERVERLIGPPSRSVPPRPIRPPVPGTEPSGDTVLFVTSNGSGMGHLTRALAIARRSSENVRPIFLTLSQAVSVVRDMGFLCEYYPSWTYWGVKTSVWHPRFARRFERILTDYEPRAVVFEGTAPYPGITTAADNHPGVPFAWVRRAMWRPGAGFRDRLEEAQSFDLVIEPGEIAAPFDQGLTTEYRDHALVVDPVLLLDPEEALERDEARAALGLDGSGPIALVTLGAGNINDLSSTVRASVTALSDAGFAVVVTNPTIADSDIGTSSGVKAIRVHPLARYLRAFDLAVSASGYNSFHELIAAGVPTIFVPNEATALDNQAARARFAGEHGLGAYVPEASAATSLRDAVERLSDPGEREVIGKRAREAFERNGAVDAMDAIEAMHAMEVVMAEKP